MYYPVVLYDPEEFITTAAGVKVSRKANIEHPQNVEMSGGKIIILNNVVIHGDFCRITINRYCFIEDNTILCPCNIPNRAVQTVPTTSISGDDVLVPNPDLTYVPMHIGKYTHIGKDCIIQAACIGVGCRIGNNCVISNRAILKDHVHVLDNCVVPPDLVAPPFSILSGNPAKIVGEVSESHPTSVQFDSKKKFKMFKPMV